MCPSLSFYSPKMLRIRSELVISPTVVDTINKDSVKSSLNQANISFNDHTYACKLDATLNPISLISDDEDCDSSSSRLSQFKLKADSKSNFETLVCVEFAVDSEGSIIASHVQEETIFCSALALGSQMANCIDRHAVNVKNNQTDITSNTISLLSDDEEVDAPISCSALTNGSSQMANCSNSHSGNVNDHRVDTTSNTSSLLLGDKEIDVLCLKLPDPDYSVSLKGCLKNVLEEPLCKKLPLNSENDLSSQIYVKNISEIVLANGLSEKAKPALNSFVNTISHLSDDEEIDAPISCSALTNGSFQMVNCSNKHSSNVNGHQVDTISNIISLLSDDKEAPCLKVPDPDYVFGSKDRLKNGLEKSMCKKLPLDSENNHISSQIFVKNISEIVLANGLSEKVKPALNSSANTISLLSDDEEVDAPISCSVLTNGSSQMANCSDSHSSYVNDHQVDNTSNIISLLSGDKEAPCLKVPDLNYVINSKDCLKNDLEEPMCKKLTLDSEDGCISSQILVENNTEMVLANGLFEKVKLHLNSSVNTISLLSDEEEIDASCKALTTTGNLIKKYV